mgnify:CR=1 FL=1
MATATLSTSFGLRITNDAGANFTVSALARPFRIFQCDMTSSGAANPVIVGKNGIGASEEIFTTNVSGSGITPALFSGTTTPNIDRGVIGSMDYVQISPASVNLNQLILSCIGIDSALTVS